MPIEILIECSLCGNNFNFEKVVGTGQIFEVKPAESDNKIFGPIVLQRVDGTINLQNKTHICGACACAIKHSVELMRP